MESVRSSRLDYVRFPFVVSAITFYILQLTDAALD